MNKLVVTMLSLLLSGGTGMLLGQQQSPNPTSPPTNSQDVPHQEPGTDNPDLGKQRRPTPGNSTDTQQNTGKKNKSKRRKATTSETSTTSQD